MKMLILFASFAAVASAQDQYQPPAPTYNAPAPAPAPSQLPAEAGPAAAPSASVFAEQQQQGSAPTPASEYNAPAPASIIVEQPSAAPAPAPEYNAPAPVADSQPAVASAVIEQQQEVEQAPAPLLIEEQQQIQQAPAPASSYGVPDTPPGPYGGGSSSPVEADFAPAPAPAPAPASSYSVPATAPGPYGGSSSSAASFTSAPAAPAPGLISSYSVPATPSGPYGGGASSAGSSSSGGFGNSVTYVPGQYVTSGYHNQYYAPLFRTVYVPVSTGYTAPAPSAGYGVPSPASSYGVPVTAPGPYGGGHAASSSYAAPQPQYVAQRQHIGNALVRNWLTQTLLHGGGRIIQRHYKDGYNGYKTQNVEQWQDQVPNYNYGYDITGPYGHEDTSATETRYGGRTSGRYSLKQPDGRTRIVEYTADENGFHPTVTYA